MPTPHTIANGLLLAATVSIMVFALGMSPNLDREAYITEDDTAQARAEAAARQRFERAAQAMCGGPHGAQAGWIEREDGSISCTLKTGKRKAKPPAAPAAPAAPATLVAEGQP